MIHFIEFPSNPSIQIISMQIILDMKIAICLLYLQVLFSLWNGQS